MGEEITALNTCLNQIGMKSKYRDASQLSTTSITTTWRRLNSCTPVCRFVEQRILALIAENPVTSQL
jgi:hypothetical protein